MITRREFIDGGGKLLLALTTTGLLPRRIGGFTPESPLPKLLLVIRVHGGMDCLQGLNPWTLDPPHPGDLFLDEGYEAQRFVGGSEISLGPSATALAKHIGEFSVVNGIFMGIKDDPGHRFAQHYMASATSTASPHFIALAAEDRALRTENTQSLVFAGDIRAIGLNRVNTSSVFILQSQNSSDSAHSLAKKTGVFSRGSSSFSRAYESLVQEARGNGAEKRRLAELLSTFRERFENLHSEYVALASFASGYAQFAQIDWNANDFDLDNHSGFPQKHLREQKKVWNRVSDLIDILKETPYLETNIPLFPDLTTLLVTTEFSRPPFLNRNHGKDHNFLDNSLLIGGRGVVGGKVLGGHRLFQRDHNRRESQLSGLPLDFTTGETIVDPSLTPHDLLNFRGGGLIRPENILRTLAHIIGMDRMNPAFRDAPLLPRIVS